MAGGGIAGLCAALSLEHFGFAVTVFEKSPDAQHSGAGLQLSPNATRILAKINALPRLEAASVEPSRVLLISGKSAKTLLSMDISSSRERWGAPYLVLHRSDLRAALLEQAQTRPAIKVVTGAEVTHFAKHANGVTVSVTSAGRVVEAEGRLLVGADGVWSKLRAHICADRARYSGHTAHRVTLDAQMPMPKPLRELTDHKGVAAFLVSNAHLVAYPLRNGSQLNLVAITRSASPDSDNAAEPPPSAFSQFQPELAQFLSSQPGWSKYPIHTVRPSGAWTDGTSMMLIGDAAHAMSPYGAQGAAMAIEDAWTLAACVSRHRADLAPALPEYEKHRRPRIAAVVRRTAMNRFAYHCHGLTAAARDTLFRLRGQKMLDGLDWIYGFEAD